MRFNSLENRSLGFFFATVMMAFAIVCSPALANSKYAAIVVDAKTGKVLHSENADSRRFPASLTKMMTLYLTFEALERGKIRKTTPVLFSAQAAAQPPTKIGVKAGKSITVEQAILSLITRSANDSSVALAELIGGSEQRFALMMTQKARSLGMRNTLFRNPNGLPNPGQYSTARDLATLGIALREHFPQYYSYFSVRSFKFGRQRIANHNRLLGKIRGIDGIKTGYTRASGFNLVSSVGDGNKRIVAVVMGGASARSRDARMATLIATYMPKARSTGGGALVASKSDSGAKTLAAALLPKRKAPTPDWRPDQDAEVAIDEADVVETTGDEIAEGGEPETDVMAMAPAHKGSRPRASVDPTQTASTAASGQWVIQVGSSPSRSEATSVLSRTQSAVSALADASGYTVSFAKGGTTYYRARFSGFGSQAAATRACASVKRQKIDCYATQQD